MVPPIQPSSASHNPYTPTLSSRSSNNSLARSVPSRPSSAQRNDGPVLNHIQQRFASPPPRMASPYIPLAVPPNAPAPAGGSYIPANDPLFADLFGGGSSKSNRSGNFFAPDPQPAASPGGYGQPSHEHEHGYGPPPPPRQQQQYDSYAQQYSPYGYEQPVMRMRGGGGLACDPESELDDEEREDVRPVLRLRGGADLGDMDDDDGNRSADDWGFGDDAGPEEDAWGFDDDAVPPTPPSPPLPTKAAQPSPIAAQRQLPNPAVSPPPSARAPPVSSPVRPSFHAPSASITSVASSTGSLSRSRPPSYAYTPSLAPPPLASEDQNGADDEPAEVGDDAWGFGEEEDEVAPPSPLPPQNQNEQHAEPPAPVEAPASPPAPTPPPPAPAAASVGDDLELDSFGGEDDWGFSAEDGGEPDELEAVVDSQVVAEQPSDLLDYEEAVEHGEEVKGSPPPSVVADEVVDEEQAPLASIEDDAPAEDKPEDEGWGIDERVADDEPLEQSADAAELNLPGDDEGAAAPLEQQAEPVVSSPPSVVKEEAVDTVEVRHVRLLCPTSRTLTRLPPSLRPPRRRWMPQGNPSGSRTPTTA